MVCFVDVHVALGCMCIFWCVVVVVWIVLLGCGGRVVCVFFVVSVRGWVCVFVCLFVVLRVCVCVG